MKTVVVGITAGVGGLALGLWAGWQLRKRQEIRFVEVTEEEQQAYAAQFEEKMKDEGPSESEEEQEKVPIPKIEKEEQTEGTNIDPILDTRKTDYANAWKRDEIIKRENYGEPTPGDPEDLSVDEKDMDPHFVAEISQERIIPISSKDFYDANNPETRETIFWYDRDDVLTHLNDDEVEEVIDDPKEFFGGGLNVQKEFDSSDDVDLEVAGSGMRLYRKDTHMDILYQLIRYPQSYGKRQEQEEYGGTDYLEWMHRRQ